MGDVIPTLMMGAIGLYALVVLIRRWVAEDQRMRVRDYLRADRPESSEEVSKLVAQERLLLLRVLTPEQEQAYRTRGCFEVRAASGRRYRITSGAANNITELDRMGCSVARLCIGTRRYTSEAGQLAAQVLLLSTDEEAFRKIANISRNY